MAKKHSKFKNTGMIFELLVRQIASDTISGSDSKALEVVKEFFNKDTELSKELQLYKTLLEDKFSDNAQAEKFVDLVMDYRRKLDSKKLLKEKYELVKAIKENYDVNDFFKARINGYTQLASIYMMFESTGNSAVQPAKMLSSKMTLVEHISKQPAQKEEIKNSVLDEFKQMDQDLRLLSYKMLVDNFNQTFGEVLNEQQKELLKRYINNITDSTALRDYINEEIPKIKTEIETLLEKVEDEVTTIKLKEVIDELPNYLKGTIISENHILTLMRYYSLIVELKRVV